MRKAMNRIIVVLAIVSAVPLSSFASEALYNATPAPRFKCLPAETDVFLVDGQPAKVSDCRIDNLTKEATYVVTTSAGAAVHAAFPFLLLDLGFTPPPGH